MLLGPATKEQIKVDPANTMVAKYKVSLESLFLDNSNEKQVEPITMETMKEEKIRPRGVDVDPRECI